MQLHLTSDFLSARTSPFFQLVFQSGFPSSFPPLQWGPVSKTLCPHFILLADFSIPKHCASICWYITVLSINGSNGYLKEFQSHMVFKEHHLRRWIELVWKEAEALPAPAAGLDCLLRSSRAGHQEASENCTMTSCSPWSYPGWATAPVSQWVSSRMAPAYSSANQNGMGIRQPASPNSLHALVGQDDPHHTAADCGYVLLPRAACIQAHTQCFWTYIKERNYSKKTVC